MSTASTYLIRALLPLIAPLALLSVALPTPTAISANSGGGQWATEGGSYANHLVATVTDSSNVGVVGVTVNFSGPGIVSTGSVSDANGVVSVPVTASSTPGGNTVTASIDGSPQIMTTFGLMGAPLVPARRPTLSPRHPTSTPAEPCAKPSSTSALGCGEKRSQRHPYQYLDFQLLMTSEIHFFRIPR
jgi:hypothetical protein